MKNLKKIVHAILVILLVTNCREKYTLPYSGPARGYLVVEGFINSGAGPTEIKLSRTVGLVDSVSTIRERQATVTVEGRDNSVAQLTETSPGVYRNNQLTLNNNLQYRLHIITQNGNDYYSEYEDVLTTPPIDTINWQRENGVEIFVNTHDAQNNTRYYRWDYQETWEFHSNHFSFIQYQYNPSTGKVDTVIDRPIEEGNKLFYCWQTENSSKILIGTSTSFTRDSIHLPVTIVPEASWKISVLYSINVKQYAISSDEYEFLRRMKKNTEQVGSLFDAQPSELTGNIHNSNDPSEIIVGHVGIANVTEKRIFISNNEVPDWGYTRYCELEDIKIDPDTLEERRFAIPINVSQVNPFTNVPTRIFVTIAVCADCSLRGFNTKPTYWP